MAIAINSFYKQCLFISQLCENNELMRSVFFRWNYIPPKEIEPFTIDDILEYLIKNLFIWEQKLQVL